MMPAPTSRALSFWFYLTFSLSLLTLLLSLLLNPLSPSTSTSLPLPLRRHYLAGKLLKLRHPTNPSSSFQLFAIESVPKPPTPTLSSPVLLLHGLALSSFSFRHLLPSLSSHGLPSIAIDLPGSGFSDKLDNAGIKTHGFLTWILPIYREIREKGVFWGFDQLVETGQIPDAPTPQNAASSSEMGMAEQVVAQVFDVMLQRTPFHLVLHDSAWGYVVNWVSSNPGLVRSVTFIDLSPDMPPAFPFRVLEVPLVGDLVVRSRFFFGVLVKACCLRSADAGEDVEVYRGFMKDGVGRRGVVAAGMGLNNSFDLGEWVALDGVRELKFQLLWSSSWSDRWIDEGRRIAGLLPGVRFAWHSGGRWPQEDAAEEVAGLISEFVSSLPKSKQEPPPESIKRMSNEEGGNNDHLHRYVVGHDQENVAHYFGMQGLGQEWGT